MTAILVLQGSLGNMYRKQTHVNWLQQQIKYMSKRQMWKVSVYLFVVCVGIVKCKEYLIIHE